MRKQRGFTLVEVMIAIVLFSMIMLATVSALRAFGNTKETLERMTGRVDEIRLVSRFLRNAIGSALPVGRSGGAFPGVDDLSRHGLYFWGGPSELIWVAPLSGGAGFGGVYVLRLSREQGKLVLRWHPYLSNASLIDWDGMQRRVLLDEVEALRLGYRADPSRVSAGGEWVEEWSNSFGNPATVRLSIKADGKYWPELVVRLNDGRPNVR